MGDTARSTTSTGTPLRDGRSKQYKVEDEEARDAV